MSRSYSFRTVIEGREAEVRIHEPNYAGEVEDAKLFKVIVFDSEGRVLAVRTKRVIDLPGGRVEWEDDTLAEAARREVLETARVMLGPLALAAVLAATPAGGGPPLSATTTVVLASRAVATSAARATLRMDRHAFLGVSKLLQRYNAGPTDLLRVLIDMADFALLDEAPGADAMTRKRASTTSRLLK